jgi:hypothetical protein
MSLGSRRLHSRPASAIYFRVAYDGAKNFKNSIDRVSSLQWKDLGEEEWRAASCLWRPVHEFLLDVRSCNWHSTRDAEFVRRLQLGTLPTSRRELRIRADSDNPRCTVENRPKLLEFDSAQRRGQSRKQRMYQ